MDSGSRSTLPPGPSGTGLERRLSPPFVFLRMEFDTLEGLLKELTTSPDKWSRGKVLMNQGRIRDWLREAGDEERARVVDGVAGGAGEGDRKLFRLIHSLSPSAPFSWRGKPFSRGMLMDLLRRGSRAQAGEDDQALLEQVFGEGMFREYLSLKSSLPDDIGPLVGSAQAMRASEIGGMPIAELCRLVLAIGNGILGPAEPFRILRSALTGDPDAAWIVGLVGKNGFSAFAAKNGLWSGTDDPAWRLLPDLVMPATVDQKLVGLLCEAGEAPVKALRELPGFDRLLRGILLRTLGEAEIARDDFQLLPSSPWFDDLLRAAFQVPEGKGVREFLIAYVCRKEIHRDWEILDPYLLPPFFNDFRNGKPVTEKQVEMIREVLKNPGILIPTTAVVSSWKGLQSFLEGESDSATVVECFEDLAIIKKAYARKRERYFQVMAASVGLGVASISAMLLGPTYPPIVISGLLFASGVLIPGLVWIPYFRRLWERFRPKGGTEAGNAFDPPHSSPWNIFTVTGMAFCISGFVLYGVFLGFLLTMTHDSSVFLLRTGCELRLIVPGMDPVLHSFQQRNPEALRYLLHRFGENSALAGEERKRQLLSEAIAGKWKPGIEILLSSTNLSQKRNGDWRILFGAIRSKDVEIVREVMRWGIDLKLVSPVEDSALHEAVMQGAPEMVRFLLGKGLEVNAVNVEGQTPLHYCLPLAGRNPSQAVEVARILLAAGADKRLRDRRGQTLLGWIELTQRRDNGGILLKVLEE